MAHPTPTRIAPTRIAVIGAGRVGATLGRRWADLGHDVVYGVRDPGADRHVDLGATATPTEAAAGADVVLVALPWAAVEAVVTGLDVGAAVVLDATNPLPAGDDDPEVSGSATIRADGATAREPGGDGERAQRAGGRSPHGHSGSERVARWLGSSRVVKAFNTTGSANMADPAGYPVAPLLPVAGDDAGAKATAMALAAELGFDPVDAGPLAAARDLEHLAALWIRLAYRLGHGPDVAFALVRR